MYDPVSNSITIPAGILQAPLYEASATYEENLGGIGFVIAHEISHAFDSVGAYFDESGNINKWWTEQDYNSFCELCQKIIDEYNNHFPVILNPNDLCSLRIVNNKVLNNLNMIEKYISLGINHFMIIFTTETKEEITEVLKKVKFR